MHLKANLNKHKLSFTLSWLWALAGLVVFALFVRAVFLPAFRESFAGGMDAVKPLLLGSCVCYWPSAGS